MKTNVTSFFINCLVVLLIPMGVWAQPALHIQIVSHNEPNDSLQFFIKYMQAKSKLLQMADIIDTRGLKWNIQTSDGMVMGARNEQINAGNNIFNQLQSLSYIDNIEIDPRNKSLPGRNIADQWYLLDSLGANPTHTVGGFIYTTCAPVPTAAIDWWPYEDTITGIHYGNKVKFDLLSGAGSNPAHCNDLNDFGIFKPDTVTNFYVHNPQRNLWCIGTGCAPLLDSMSNVQSIIDLIQGQVDSIQNGWWPGNKFYVTRIMTNQSNYGPMFFSKLNILLDSLALIPSSQLKWAKLTECMSDFFAWSSATGNAYSQWLCDHGPITTGVLGDEEGGLSINPCPASDLLTFNMPYEKVLYEVYTLQGEKIKTGEVNRGEMLNISELRPGCYDVRLLLPGGDYIADRKLLVAR